MLWTAIAMGLSAFYLFRSRRSSSAIEASPGITATPFDHLSRAASAADNQRADALDRLAPAHRRQGARSAAVVAI